MMNASDLTLNSWFHVTFDETGFYRRVHPPHHEGYEDFVQWNKIIRICFKLADDFLFSDELYIFTSERPDSYVIPTEAKGASELWGEIIHRGLFDARLAITAATSSEGIFCWPPVSE
jgi:hypothetical protein